jgi:hypothetical protein
MRVAQAGRGLLQLAHHLKTDVVEAALRGVAVAARPRVEQLVTNRLTISPDAVGSLLQRLA